MPFSAAGSTCISRPAARTGPAPMESCWRSFWLRRRADAVRSRFGTGDRGLACAVLRPEIAVTLVERDPAMAALARTNAASEWHRGTCHRGGILAPGRSERRAGLTADAFDCVLTNPPFFETDATGPRPMRPRVGAWFRPRGLGWLAAHLRRHPQTRRSTRNDPQGGCPARCLDALAGRFAGSR